MAKRKSKTRLQAELVHQIKQNDEGEITELSTTENLTFSHLKIDGQASGDQLTVTGTSTFSGNVTVDNNSSTFTLNSSTVNIGTGSGVKTITIGSDSDDTVTIAGTLEQTGRAYFRDNLIVDGTMNIRSGATFDVDTTFSANTISLAGALTTTTLTTGTANISTSLQFGGQTFTGVSRFRVQNVGGVDQFDAYGLTV